MNHIAVRGGSFEHDRCILSKLGGAILVNQHLFNTNC